MLLPYISVVDVITTEADVIVCFILLILLADVIANVSVADVMATYYSTMWWQMLLPGGGWKSHCRVGGH